MESREISDSRCFRVNFNVFNSINRRKKYDFVDKTKYSKEVTSLYLSLILLS